MGTAADLNLFWLVLEVIVVEVSSTVVHLKINDYDTFQHLPHVASHVGMGIAVPTSRGDSRRSILPHALRFPRQLRAVSTRLSQGDLRPAPVLSLRTSRSAL